MQKQWKRITIRNTEYEGIVLEPVTLKKTDGYTPEKEIWRKIKFIFAELAFVLIQFMEMYVFLPT